MARQIPVVTIDGPSGVGKGTLALQLAELLGWWLLDSGSLYRLTALAAWRQKVDLADVPALVRVVAALDVEFRAGRDGMTILLAGEDVSQAIRTEQCGNAASQVAALPQVRQALLQRQRDFRRPPGLVADGRDMGTVVFPDAAVKMFLTASAEERARRRHNQLREKGIDVSLAKLAGEIAERDRRDTDRQVSPLIPAPDAVMLDTTGLSIEQVQHWALDLIGRRLDV
ncbi:MAG: (d)CMP kinase [Candidatus Competibacteraceae bacterium]|nr:(d)CMP kinase [Candidatus Competibacteraceae bacterium]